MALGGIGSFHLFGQFSNSIRKGFEQNRCVRTNDVILPVEPTKRLNTRRGVISLNCFILNMTYFVTPRGWLDS